MDIMTSVGLACGFGVITLIMLMGGNLEMFWSEHAVIIIFGGSIAATMIRFPLSAILHGLPLGAKFAFTMSWAMSTLPIAAMTASPSSRSTRKTAP